MNRKGWIAFGVVAVLATIGALKLPDPQPAPGIPEPEQGQKELQGRAPSISAKTSDGKDVDLASLIKDGSVYLYFIKKDCPINARAIGFYNDISKAYKDKTRIVGVFNGTADELKEYNKDHATPYKVVLDPQHNIIEKYKVDRSPWVIEVDQSGLVGRVWKGYSQGFLQELNEAVASASKLEKAKVDLSKAPKDPAYG